MPTTDLDRDTGSGDAATGRDGEDGRPGKRASGTGKTRRRAGDALEAARDRTGALYGSARERASSAYESTREGAARARRRTAEQVDANPMAVLVGGLALGAIAAAFLPRTRRETEAFGGIGEQINERAREAARAAREAGREKLSELGLTREAARQKLSEVASGAGEAVRTATAASKARRRPAKD